MAWLICGWRLVLPLAAVEPPSPTELKIVIDPSGWGDAQPEDVRQVALSAARSLWIECPHTHLDLIYLHHRKGAPQTNWDRDEDERIVIGLASEDRRWAQMAFQFAHEFCHTLAMHSNDWRHSWRVVGKPNHWLEESLCETASLYVLRAMSHTWLSTPPYPNWSEYAPHLAEYAQDRMETQQTLLPAGRTFFDWLAKNESSMRANPTLREKNGLVATYLLPLFEAEPRGWEAITYFNTGAHDKKQSLNAFLGDWRQRCPADLKPFVSKIAGALGRPID